MGEKVGVGGKVGDRRRGGRQWGELATKCVRLCVYSRAKKKKNGGGITERRPRRTTEEKGDKLWEKEREERKGGRD